uniref:NADH-ubiquinone oxidoreductase chain 4 n=1 Tax=Diplonevra peregrina TaxID=1003499 RepID=A0A7U3QRM1_9MUSC|nr:NADH dehydrogenase subunit 4 [Diplonevra peregrina]QPN53560.1 NADH dehydrogenase subunit 4 [Diplonevra peregrina]
MLKFLLMILFLMPLCFMKKMFWMVQNVLFMISFLFIFNNYFCNYWGSMSYFFGCDLFSYGMILLSLWICSLMIMSSKLIFKHKNFMNMFIFNVLLLLLFLFLSFSTTNLFLYYVFFESSLIPTFLLIMGWGYQPERLQASVYLLFYTLLASLPLLVSIFYFYNEIYNLNFFMFFYSYDYLLLYLGMIMAFLVKMPMYLVHLWLPKAHVEAPISGSMILAGVLLKLGGYGLMRTLILIQFMGMKMNYLFISISLIGGVVVSLMCLRQIDVKMLIAYSSVAHMGIVISGLLTMTYWGFYGSYTLMIAHGLCSSGMFCLANIMYERSGSRSMLINKGFMNFMPSMALWWFLLSSTNMAAPPSLNLLSEISLLNSIISWSSMSMLMIMFISFFSAAYTLYLYSYTQHGMYYSGIYSFSNGSIREYLLLFLHWLPLNLLILKSDMFMYF